jgi:hypothetical protein
MTSGKLTLDKNTVMLIVGLLGGSGGLTKVVSDISDIRERVARIETRLEMPQRMAE